MTSHQDLANGRHWFYPVKDFLAGTAGGCAGKFIEYPFDTVKVRLQVGGAGGFGGAELSAMGVVKSTLRTTGVRGLYRGMAVPLAGTVAETSCLFTANGQAKALLFGKAADEELSMPEVLAAGAISGAAVSFVLTPIELIKCRMQVQSHLTSGPGSYAGPLDCLRRSVQAEGLRVLYKGHVSTMLREVPGTAGWFGAYELFARAMTKPGQTRDELHPASIVAAGALGGVAYWCAFYPADTVKSRVQSAPPAAAGAPATTFSSVLRGIYRAEGLRGLYRGLTPTLLRAAPANAAIFLTYEMCSRMLSNAQAEYMAV